MRRLAFPLLAPALSDALLADSERALGEEEEPHLYVSTLVVLYELLLAPHTRWTPYLRTLPRSFAELPAFFSDARPDGTPRLWTRLGALAPLAAAQREEMDALLPFVARAVSRLPRGAAALAALRPGELPLLAAWAWAVARTRMLDQPVAAFALASRMPPSIRKAPTLMPLMDLANHAEPNATNVALSSVDGVLAFCTSRRVAAGEELRFTYIDSVADAEADPSIRDEMCNDQWLSHYGFLLEDGRPERDCFHFELSLPGLRALLGDTPLPRGERRRLKEAGLPQAVHTVIDGSGKMMRRALRAAACLCLTLVGMCIAGTLWVGLLHWLSVACGTAAPGAPAEAAWQSDAQAWRLLAASLDAARLELAAALAEATALNEPDGGDGATVRALAAGALRAAAAAEEQAQLGWTRLSAPQL